LSGAGGWRALVSETLDPDGAMCRCMTPDLAQLGWTAWPLPTQEVVPHLGADGHRALLIAMAEHLRPHVVTLHPPYDYLDDETTAALRGLGARVVALAFDDAIFGPMRQRAGRSEAWSRALARRWDLYAATDPAVVEGLAPAGDAAAPARHLRFAASPEPFAERAACGVDPAALGQSAVLIGRAYPRRVALVEALGRAGVPVQVFGSGWAPWRERLPEPVAIHGVLTRPAMNAVHAAAGVVVTTGDWEGEAVAMVKYRLLEVAMAGGSQVAQRSPDLGAYFAPEEVPGYGDADELIALVRDALAAPRRARLRAERARARALREHTWASRWAELLAGLGPLADPGPPRGGPCPAYANALAVIAHGAERDGALRRAEAYFEAWSRHAPGGVGPHWGLARVAFRTGEPGKARDAAEAALARLPQRDPHVLPVAVAVGEGPRGLGLSGFLDPRVELTALWLVAAADTPGGLEAALEGVARLDDEEIVCVASILEADDEPSHQPLWRALFRGALAARPWMRPDLQARHAGRWRRTVG